MARPQIHSRNRIKSNNAVTFSYISDIFWGFFVLPHINTLTLLKNTQNYHYILEWVFLPEHPARYLHCSGFSSARQRRAGQQPGPPHRTWKRDAPSSPSPSAEPPLHQLRKEKKPTLEFKLSMIKFLIHTCLPLLNTSETLCPLNAFLFLN